MKHLRAWLRITGIIVVTGCIYVVWIIGRIILALSPAAIQRWRKHILRIWAISMAGILGMHLQRTGEPPAKPFILICNHLSYLDIFPILSSAPGMFIARADVRHWPMIGWLAKQMGTLFIDRTEVRDVVRIGAIIDNLLLQGESVMFFPEGTSTKGEQVGPFRAALLEIPARRNLPVHYAALRYSTPLNAPPASESLCWWGDMTFTDHLYRLLTIPHFEAHIIFGPEPVCDTNRKELARKLRKNVSAIFLPVT